MDWKVRDNREFGSRETLNQTKENFKRFRARSEMMLSLPDILADQEIFKLF